MATLLNIISLLTCFFYRALRQKKPPPSEVSITELWGAYPPYFDAGMYFAPPTGCHIDQLQTMQNHTDSRLDFLKTFTYSLGLANVVPFGAHQWSQAGTLAFTQYSDLVSARSLPFVHASSSPRVVDTATNRTAGFSVASHHVYNPSLSVILSENGNDTLDNSMCPNTGDSDAQTDAWLAVFAPNITAHLNHWAPGMKIMDTETYSLISMFPFHTVTSFIPSAALSLSPFCGLFTTEEFVAFEYSMDLDNYGAPLGRVQGVGYVNELLAHLKQIPMATIYAAMGPFPQAAALDMTHPTPRRTWVASRIVPFGARMVVEQLKCVETQTQFVYVLPLKFCAEAKGMGRGTYGNGGEGD
ncbi:phytase [Mycena olivaceomarginata]|nr:phytase [Mycena olivaceomarginata]